MNRYCDSWCTDVWRLGGETGGDLWGGMEEKETPASRRMCSSRQTRTGRCCERTASRVSFVLLRVGIVFRYRFVLPFALEFTWRFPVKCRCFPDIFIFFLDFYLKNFCYLFYNIENAANLLTFYCGRQKCTFWKSGSRQLISIKIDKFAKVLQLQSRNTHIELWYRF